MTEKIRIRFAPSPTGQLHLGGVRTALYNYIYSKQTNGTFILRIEDTDRSRYVEGSVENLIKSLTELGINFDEGPYFQSERLELYHQHVEELIANDKAYKCYCTKEELEAMRIEQTKNNETTKYNGKCRDLIPENMPSDSSYVVRMKIPADKIFEFNDIVRGNIQISSHDLEDQVILKADGFPTYHLASVVDDHYMNISHVLRGEEWLYSTPKHLFLYESLGWKPPVWVHLPLLLNTDKTKLSKRHGDFSVENYLSSGYLKESIINFVALLGWHSSDDKELYSLEELINSFSLERITKSGAVFDITKLDWMNSWYLRNLPLEYVAEICKPFFLKENIDISDNEKYLKVINRVRDQLNKVNDVYEHSKVFYTDFTISDENRQILMSDDSQKVLNWFLNKLQMGNDPSIETIMKEAPNELGLKGKSVFFPLRIALYGDCHGPDIPTLVSIYGIEETIRKIVQWIN